MASPIKKVKAEDELENKEIFSKGWKSADVVLVVGEKHLHVHSQVLSIESPVFERMFQSGFKESKSKKVEMKGKKYVDMVNILKILYPSMVIDLSECKNIFFITYLIRRYFGEEKIYLKMAMVFFFM